MSDVKNASGLAPQPRSLEYAAIAGPLAGLTAGYTVFVAGAATAIGVYGLVLWSYRGLRDAVLKYGWGNVPPEELNIFEFFDTWHLLLDYGPAIVLGIGFLVAMSRARGIVEAVGVPIRYSYGWTVATLFIPIVNLVRPWLGFAEIRRAVFGIVATGESRASSGFSFFTLLLALVIFLGTAVLRAVGNEVDRVTEPTTQAEFFVFADQIETLLLIGASAQAVQLVTMWFYLATIRNRAVLLVDRTRRSSVN